MHEDLIHLGLIDEDEILLDRAALALASLDHPDVDPALYLQLFDAIATRLEAVGSGAATDRERGDALSHVLGGEFGFVGDRDTYDDPANADLIRVVDRRRGLPVSLSILYVSAARRLGWSADILDLPGHVLVLVGGEAAATILDPFRGGVAVEREQVAAMLAAAVAGPVPPVRHIRTMPNRAILVRLLLNQATRAEEAGKGGRALELYRQMTVIAPAHEHPWWQRARLELIDGDLAAARSSLTAMLEITRDPDLRHQVADMLAALVAT